MSKLSTLLVAVVALLLGGCAGQAGGAPTETFEIRTDYPGVADVCSAAAERINADAVGMQVTVKLLSPIAGQMEEPNAFLRERSGIDPDFDPTLVTTGHDVFGDPVLFVGPEASVYDVENEILEWIDLFAAEAP